MGKALDPQGWCQFAGTSGAMLTSTDAFGGFVSLMGRSFNTQLPPHVHPQYVIGLVTAGAVQVTRGNDSVVATAGDVIALAPYDVHTEAAVGEDGWSFTYLYPTERNVRAARRLAYEPGDLQTALRFPHHVIRDERIRRALEAAHQLIMLRVSQPLVETALAALFELLAGECVASDGHAKPPRYRRGVETVRSIILQESPAHHSLSELAQIAGMSVYHFDRVFGDLVGVAPGTFFQRVRVARAFTMILHGHPLREVWYRLGYADQAHLTRHFHAASAFTPGQYAALVKTARTTAS